MSEIGQRLIEIVRAKAAENPDFIYEPPGGSGHSCVYVYRGEPSCLLGHALWEAGLIDEKFEHRLEELNGLTYPQPLNEEGFGDIASALNLDLDAHERAWLENVQTHQDNERMWGTAPAVADDLAKDDDE